MRLHRSQWERKVRTTQGAVLLERKACFGMTESAAEIYTADDGSLSQTGKGEKAR